MKLSYSQHFLRSYEKAPPIVRSAFEKQVRFLIQDLHHPSLHAKKYNEARGVWQARINRDWRFYFTIEGNTYCLHEMKSHPKK